MLLLPLLLLRRLRRARLPQLRRLMKPLPRRLGRTRQWMGPKRPWRRRTPLQPQIRRPIIILRPKDLILLRHKDLILLCHKDLILLAPGNLSFPWIAHRVQIPTAAQAIPPQRLDALAARMIEQSPWWLGSSLVLASI